MQTLLKECACSLHVALQGRLAYTNIANFIIKTISSDICPHGCIFLVWNGNRFELNDFERNGKGIFVYTICFG